MQGVPNFTNFIWGVHRCLDISNGAQVLNRGCLKAWVVLLLTGEVACLCCLPWPPALCFFIYRDLPNLPQELQRDFLPALMATPWPILTHEDTEQPKFETIALVPPKERVCVPDQGDVPCLSEGPRPTPYRPHWPGSEVWGAKFGWEQFENCISLDVL